jgi:hypothetical protein
LPERESGRLDAKAWAAGLPARRERIAKPQGSAAHFGKGVDPSYPSATVMPEKDEIVSSGEMVEMDAIKPQTEC